MNCSRYRGLMVAAHFLDDENEYGERERSSKRCVNYAHAHDSIIERNRLMLWERGWCFQAVNRTLNVRKRPS
jgi:hypothetical protein